VEGDDSASSGTTVPDSDSGATGSARSSEGESTVGSSTVDLQRTGDQ
jgi:hypothetical protein